MSVTTKVVREVVKTAGMEYPPRKILWNRRDPGHILIGGILFYTDAINKWLDEMLDENYYSRTRCRGMSKRKMVQGLTRRSKLVLDIIISTQD